MEIVIKERIARRMRADLAEVQVFFAHAKKGWRTRRDGECEVDDDVVLDLSKLTANEVERLHDALATSKILGTKVLASDVKKYLRAGIDGIEGMTARTVRQAAWLIEHTIASLPHHLLFSPDAYGGGSYVGYFVNDVDFTEEDHSKQRSPAPSTRQSEESSFGGRPLRARRTPLCTASTRRKRSGQPAPDRVPPRG